MQQQTQDQITADQQVQAKIQVSRVEDCLVLAEKNMRMTRIEPQHADKYVDAQRVNFNDLINQLNGAVSQFNKNDMLNKVTQFVETNKEVGLFQQHAYNANGSPNQPAFIQLLESLLAISKDEGKTFFFNLSDEEKQAAFKHTNDLMHIIGKGKANEAARIAHFQKGDNQPFPGQMKDPQAHPPKDPHDFN